MAEFQEDKLGVLDIAKTVVATSVLPQYQYMYNPGMFDAAGGRLKMPDLKSNWLINNPLTRGVGRLGNWGLAKLMGKKPKSYNVGGKKFTLSGGQQLAVAQRHAMSRAGKGAGTFANKILRPIGLEAKGGYIGLNDISYKDTDIWKNLKEQKAAAKEAVKTFDERRVAEYNKATKRTGGRTGKIASRSKKRQLLNALSGVEESAAYASRVSGAAVPLSGSANWAQRLFGFSKFSEKSLLKLKVSGLRVAQAAYWTGRGVGRLAVRGAIGMGKLGAYGMIAGLIWEGAKMIGNPIASAAVQGVDSVMNSFSALGQREMGGKLNMAYLSQGAATERQRAMQAINNSRFNGRSQLGNEAQFMHQ